MELTPKEAKESNKFISNHLKKCPNGKFTYMFSSKSGIGVSMTICCLICKEEKDITDYNSW